MRFSVESGFGKEADAQSSTPPQKRMQSEDPWQTIQVKVDELLLAEVEQAASALQMTCLDFMKLAVERAVQQRQTISLERRQKQADLDLPQK